MSAEASADVGGRPVLEVRDVSKKFGAVQALTDVTLALHAGEVLGLVGDNGAGKSTLVRCIGGIHRLDGGAVSIDGLVREHLDPEVARELGIETVHQHLSLVERFDVTENMFLNRELTRRGIGRQLGWLDKRAMHRQTVDALSKLSIQIDAGARVANLSGGQRQIIAVARAVTWGSHIVMLDEPAAALGVRQSEMVLTFVRMLAGRGVAVLFITHNMEHVTAVTDRVVVLRQGRKVADMRTEDTSPSEIVGHITGGHTVGRRAWRPNDEGR